MGYNWIIALAVFVLLCLFGLAGWICFVISRAAEEEKREQRGEM